MCEKTGYAGILQLSFILNTDRIRFPFLRYRIPQQMKSIPHS